MTKEKHFLKHLSLAFVGISILVLLVVTWADPYRSLNFPWQTSFISDRNVAYKRYKLMEASPKITDLIVGSSTCEIFQPYFLKKHFPIEPFNAGTPAASVQLRYLLIKAGLKLHPELKRVIYVADLFEFNDFDLPSKILFQPELRSYLDDEDLSRIKKPDFESRLHDYISDLVIERSLATLKDFVKNGLGLYHSRFHPDGGTNRSMIVVNPRDPIKIRALTTAIEQRGIYGEMKSLNQDTLWMYQKLVRLIESTPGVELHIVLAPFHKYFFNRFRNNFERTQIYKDWLHLIHKLGESPSGRIRVHDFSFPNYLKFGVKYDSSFWIDGVHFSSETMMKMAEQIFPKANPKPCLDNCK